MRILVLIQPTNKYGTKAEYTKLRNFLVSDGYVMLQPEVFMRLATSRKGAEKHLRRLQKYAPTTGRVRILKLTERQYSNIEFLTGNEDEWEETVGRKLHIML